VEIPLEAVYSADCPPIHARIQDLCGDGLFIDTSHPLAVGSTIDVSFDLPDDGPPIKTKARVVWSAPMMGSGVEFLGLPEDQRIRINFFVAEVFFSKT